MAYYAPATEISAAVASTNTTQRSAESLMPKLVRRALKNAKHAAPAGFIQPKPSAPMSLYVTASGLVTSDRAVCFDSYHDERIY